MEISKPVLILVILVLCAAITLHIKIVMLKSLKSDNYFDQPYKLDYNNLLSILLITLPGFSKILIFN